MAAIENRLNGIKNRNWDNGIKDRELNILISQLLLEHNEVDVEELIADAMEKSQRMKETYKQADEMNLRIRYDLKKEAEKLRNMASPEGELLFTQIMLVGGLCCYRATIDLESQNRY